MSLAEGSLKPVGAGALGRSPVREIGGCSRVDMAVRRDVSLKVWLQRQGLAPLLFDSGMDGESVGTESRVPPTDVIELAAEGRLVC